MINSIISCDRLKNKQTNNSAAVGNIIVNDNNLLRTIDGETDLTVSNALKINNKTLDEIRSNIDAKTIDGLGINDILSKDRYKIIKKMVTTNKTAAPSQSMLFVTQNEDILFRGYNNSGYFVNGQAANTMGFFTIYNPNKGISNIKEIYGVHCSYYVLYENGDLYFIGAENTGHSGTGNNASKFVLTLSTTNVKQVATTSSGHHYDNLSVLILKNDGTVWGSGYNGNGELGIGNNSNQSFWSKAVIPFGLGTPIDIIVGNNVNGASYILTDTGKVLAAGYNGVGQLGDGTTVSKNTFIQVGALNDYNIVKLQASGGSYNARYNGSVICLTDTGRVFVWGYNGLGTFGNSTTSNSLIPIDVTDKIPLPHDPVSNPIVDVFTTQSDYNTSALLTKNGDLFMAGYNGYGQIGDGTTVNKTQWFNTFNNVKSFQFAKTPYETYYMYCIVLTNDNKLVTWGYNGNGQCGQNHTTNVLLPTKVNFEYSSEIKQINTCGFSAGMSTYVLLNDGRVFGTGSNDYQQISDNSCANIRRFIKVI